jgi:hypothetical protein
MIVGDLKGSLRGDTGLINIFAGRVVAKYDKSGLGFFSFQHSEFAKRFAALTNE